MKRKRIRKICLITLLTLSGLILGLLIYINTYRNPSDKTLSESGIVEKQIQLGDVKFNYAEGPDNGPALLLLHAQTLDWYTYSEVLPELSENYHVYAVDYPGHGKTVTPEGYSMSANQIGEDLARLMENVIGEPAYITGNSSGGLLCVWLAANKGELVKACVLEDPPLFSSEYDELSRTVADKLFTLSYNAVENGDSDEFLLYWLDHSDAFFEKYAGGSLGQDTLRFVVKSYKTINPDKPLEIPFLSPTVQEMVRGMNNYDPHFGAAFHDGSWNEGFDHEQALQKIKCPVLLIQANYDYLEDGTLDGAMSQEMSDYAVSLIEDCTYVKVDSGHVTNMEVPDQFIDLIDNFCSR